MRRAPLWFSLGKATPGTYTLSIYTNNQVNLPQAAHGCLRQISFCRIRDMNNTIPLTKYGAELLKEELHQLKTKERRIVIDAIAEARSHGDLSENAEYDAAKERQAFVEGRIAELEGKLSAAQIIDPATLDAEGRVVFASTVDLEDLETGAKVSYQIVGLDEADLKLNKVSVTSPIARALIGKYAGDVVEVQAPSGPREYEILEVRYV